MNYEDLPTADFKHKRKGDMDKLRQLFFVVVDLVAPSAKAFVAFLVTTAAVWLAKHGVDLEVDTVDAATSALSGLLSASLVWLTRNRQ